MDYSNFRSDWTKAFKNKKFKTQFIITVLALSILLPSLNYFFAFIEKRQGYQINDVILNLAEPVDVSLYTFLIIYSAALLSIAVVLPQPFLFLKAVQAYALMLLVRLITLYFVPLNAPENIIPLNDPFIERFFYGQVRITKDLFFSGHVATVCLLYLVNPIKKLNWFYLVVTVLVALLIMIQRVHYSFDVFAAPIFAWIAYKLSQKL
jgi:membrane-associated phospholipid phosphatase